MKSEYLFLILAVFIYLIFSNIINYQKYKYIASHTSQKEFEFYLNMRILSSVLLLVVIIIYMIPMFNK